ncbi:uncharacterized protein LOC116922062 isoform X1 [Daphnia magna]|uniref:uncharacterized protein LOC116922062 isoform X1 n=2 Tax=Daphnia magna TaxID=35525 RepID=UPI001E1BA42F|nr:uncharacterized protein LOC116922062 isoform X1 [Daphnia magna]
MAIGVSSFEFGGRCRSCCALFLCFWIFMAGPVSGTLHIQQIVVPVQVMTGSNVVLRCLFTDTDSSSTLPTSNHREALTDYDHIAGGPLYSLKWYKGSHEFYRHLPRENPPTKVFHWSQFNIETDALEPGKVILRGVTPEAEGSYKCEVSAEGTFHTDVAEANLTVIDVENEAITLTPDLPLDEARIGDRRKWNCTFGRSRPRAHIAWFINGEPVSHNSRYLLSSKSMDSEAWTTNPNSGTTKRLEWVNSVLELTLAERHFKNQWLRVSCVVQIGSGYKKTKEVYVREEQKGSAGRQSNRNPSPVVGANGSRTGSNREDEFHPSMSKIAGSKKANSDDSGSHVITGSSLLSSLISTLTLFHAVQIANHL